MILMRSAKSRFVSLAEPEGVQYLHCLSVSSEELCILKKLTFLDLREELDTG